MGKVVAFILTLSIGAFLLVGNISPIAQAVKKDTHQKQVKTVAQIDDIKTKMLNSIHYYNDVKGSFKHVTQRRDIVVEFEVQEGEDPYSYIKVRDKQGIVKESIANDSEVLTLYPREKGYKEIKKQPINPEKLKELNRPSNELKDGKTIKKLRPDPATALDAQIVTYPQQIAYWLDDNEQNYKITGSESFLNRDSTVIEGKLLDSLVDKFDANNFKMWVDTETGVLLKLITTNENGEETSIIEVQEIEFNKGINNKRDTKIQKNFKKY